MSKQEEIEQRIREQRILEANKKGIVGQNGKIGVVLRMMGSAIMSHEEGGGYVETNYLYGEDQDEPTSIQDMMRGIPTMDVDGAVRPETEEWTQMNDPVPYGVQRIGWHFDGLSRGMHLEIKYDDYTTEFMVSHKGYTVYKEIKGEIVSYAPNDEWEGWINTLYKIAKEMRRREKEEEFDEQVRNTERQKANWWSDIKSRWGIE